MIAERGNGIAKAWRGMAKYSKGTEVRRVAVQRQGIKEKK
jgi:hypothetical protein